VNKITTFVTKLFTLKNHEMKTEKTLFKIGDIIPVSPMAEKVGISLNSYSEKWTGTKIIGDGGEWVTHTSSVQINEFATGWICVHPEEYSERYFQSNAKKDEITKGYFWTTFVYSIYLPKGTIVEMFNDDEYRLPIDNLSPIFSGILYEAKGKPIIRNGRISDTYIKYSETKKGRN
jgi:hypothetical protein